MLDFYIFEWIRPGKFIRFSIGQKNIGVSLGLWHGIGLSVSGEMILKEFPEIYGVIGVGGEIGYASYERKVLSVPIWDETYIPIFGFASYHYKFSDPRIDPYIRIGLGFVYVSASNISGYAGSIESRSSYIDISGQIGARYALTPKLWARGALGTPWILSVGIDYMF